MSPEGKPKPNLPENRPNASVPQTKLDAILSATRDRVASLRSRARELERRALDRTSAYVRWLAGAGPRRARSGTGSPGGGAFGERARAGPRRGPDRRRREQPRSRHIRRGSRARRAARGAGPGRGAGDRRERDRDARGRGTNGRSRGRPRAGGHIGGRECRSRTSCAGADGRAETGEGTVKPVGGSLGI